MSQITPQTLLRQLPSIDRLLNDPAVLSLLDTYGRDLVRDALRQALDSARRAILDAGHGAGTPVAPTADGLFAQAADLLARQSTSSLRPVINATGVIIHTNLGRAPLSTAAQEAMLNVARGYSTLEYQLETGKRGKRDTHVESMVTAVTGAAAALVVNNNAAAIMLILSALAGTSERREVLISRGQLVEIGGGFRMPDVMAQSGAHLVEVGTTNRTRIEDFARAITPNTAMLLRVHASNFKQMGFVAQPSLESLAKLATERGVLAVDDLGSGALLDTARYGLGHEPTVQESLAAGFDLVCFSGDKLLGGPQAGIIVGRADLVALLKKHPLARAFRADKFTIAGLVATLAAYRRGEAEVIATLPIWQMIAMPLEAIKARAEAWQGQIGGEIRAAHSTVGGGSLPGELLPTYVLALSPANPDAFAAALRSAALPVIGRIQAAQVLLDPRTVRPDQESLLFEAVRLAQKVHPTKAQLSRGPRTANHKFAKQED